MDFFDNLISQVEELTALPNRSDYFRRNGSVWKDAGRNEVVLLRDTAFELGGSDLSAVGCNLVTSKSIGESGVTVIGNDLCDIEKDCAFARISLIEIDDIADEQDAYNAIRKIEYVKYHIFPEGYMMRTSSENLREQIRVSKKAIKQGISFEKIGNALIDRYLENKLVRCVRIIFITDKSADYSRLYRIAVKNNEITKALNHALNHINFDCNSCNLKPICDEVEGMRELHFKNSGM